MILPWEVLDWYGIHIDGRIITQIPARPYALSRHGENGAGTE
jgi:hypothetical protein